MKAKLTDEEIDFLANAGMRNAAGGIYATSVHEFARAVEDEVINRHDVLRVVISRAANILRGGEGIQDQGEAYDLALHILEDTINES